jgi:hypothetical protein
MTRLLRKLLHSRACKAYRAAQERYQDACRRGDTRTQKVTYLSLRDAMSERLRRGA